MYKKILKDDFILEIKEEKDGFVKTGNLIDKRSKEKIPIINYIPRFCRDGYCQSFSFQWKKFRNLQHDSATGRNYSTSRLAESTKWDFNNLAGKSILEVGCGPGRFTEIFLNCGADTVAFDMSEAVDVNLQNSGLRKNLLLLQADINNLPFFYEIFDYVFCYGVLQHTPDPKETFVNLLRFLKPGGKLTVDIYRKRWLPTAFTTPKYLWRPLAKKIKKETLLKILNWYIPKYIGFDTVIKKIPKIGYILAGFIPVPCWNYLDKGYTKEERIKHAVMDTFDALSAEYDKPRTKKQVEKWLDNSELEKTEVFYGGNGIVVNARKKEKPENVFLCPLCKSGNLKIKEKITFSEIQKIWKNAGIKIEKHLVKENFSLKECVGCGLEFFSPLISGNSCFYSNFCDYKNEWDYQTIAEKIAEYDINSVLDYGCGRGTFLKSLPENIERAGIDYNAPNKQTDSLKLVKADLIDFKTDRKFKTVVSIQVLEHLKNPREHLEKIIGFLKESGFLFISVPNKEGILSRIENRGKPLDFPPHHLTRWPKKTLEKIAEIYNLKIIGILEEPLSYIHFKWSRQAPISVRYFGRDIKNLFLKRFFLLKEEIICPFLFLKVKKEAGGHSVLAIYQKNG